MATMSAAFTRLANNRKLLLPTVHKIWPVIMNRMKEQKLIFIGQNNNNNNNSNRQYEINNYVQRNSFLLPYLLDFVTLLSILCGDYLSLKLKVCYLQSTL